MSPHAEEHLFAVVEQTKSLHVVFISGKVRRNLGIRVVSNFWSLIILVPRYVNLITHLDNWRVLLPVVILLFILLLIICFLRTTTPFALQIPEVNKVFACRFDHYEVESSVAHCDTLWDILFYQD